MKALYVYENLNFERRGDPKETMNIGNRDARMKNAMDSLLKEFGGKIERKEDNTNPYFYRLDYVIKSIPGLPREKYFLDFYREKDTGEQYYSFGAFKKGSKFKSFGFIVNTPNKGIKEIREKILKNPVYKLNILGENLKFERGISVKDALNLGSPSLRMKDAMDQLARKYKSRQKNPFNMRETEPGNWQIGGMGRFPGYPQIFFFLRYYKTAPKYGNIKTRDYEMIIGRNAVGKGSGPNQQNFLNKSLETVMEWTENQLKNYTI